MLLEMEQIEYTYKKSGFTLSCPHLRIDAGETVLIRGANGSGKTTLSKLMTGLLRPRSGRVLLNGVPANGFPLGRISQTVGYLFQEPGRQLFCATVDEELLFKARFLAENIEAARVKADKLLQRFRLLTLRQRSIYKLSRGEKQRLALAAVMMQEPKLLLLDEPSAGLDSELREVLCGVLAELADTGVAIVVISHDDLFAGRPGRRIIEVKNGVVLC